MPGGGYDSQVLEEAFQAGYEYVLTSDRGLTARGDRILKRSNLLTDSGIYRLADAVYGPVSEMIDLVRRRRRARKSGSNMRFRIEEESS